MKEKKFLNKIIKKLNIRNNCVNIEQIQKLYLNDEEEITLLSYLDDNDIIVNYELEPGKLKSYDNILYNYISDLDDLPVYSKEEEHQIIAKFRKTNDVAIRDEFLKHYYRLVVSFAKIFHSNTDGTFSLMDLIQYGNMGLLMALNKFDLNKDCHFSTYAAFWIKQCMCRGYKQDISIIRFPENNYYFGKKIETLKNNYYEKNGEYPTRDYIIKQLGISDEKYDLLEKYRKPFESLDVFSFNEDEVEHNEKTLSEKFICDDFSIEQKIEKKLVMEEINKAINKCLSIKYQDIMRMRFGLKPYDRVYSLQEIGNKYGKTRERIRQIENVCLNKLKSETTLEDLLFDNIKPNNLSRYKCK